MGWLTMTCRMLLLATLSSTFVTAVAGYPEYHDTRLNDFANVVRPADAEQIRTALTELHDNTGIEAVVVTVDSIRDYGTSDATIESFATNLFNRWGIGNRERNDGAMLLVAVEDRKARIEVGSRYGLTLDPATRGIIDHVILPLFKQDDYSGGILHGTRALSTELQGWKPPAEAGRSAAETAHGGTATAREAPGNVRSRPRNADASESVGWSFLTAAAIAIALVATVIGAALGFHPFRRGYSEGNYDGDDGYWWGGSGGSGGGGSGGFGGGRSSGGGSSGGW